MREVKYLAHFGKKGQTWYVRNYQSYETVPTRSGKVGEFRGMSGKEYRKDRNDYINKNAFERTAEAYTSGAVKKDKKFRRQMEKHYAATYDAEHGKNVEKNTEKARKALEKSTKYVVNKEAVNDMATGKKSITALDYENYYQRASRQISPKALGLSLGFTAATSGVLGGYLGGAIAGGLAGGLNAAIMHEKLSSARNANKKRMQEELAAMKSITTSFDEVKKEYTTRVDLAKYEKESKDPSTKEYFNQYKEAKALEAKRKSEEQARQWKIKADEEITRRTGIESKKGSSAAIEVRKKLDKLSEDIDYYDAIGDREKFNKAREEQQMLLKRLRG